MNTPFYQNFDFYAVIISLIALGFSIYSYSRTGKRDFSSLQLKVVLDLVDKLNKSAFSFEIAKVEKDGMTTTSFTINIFELNKLYDESKGLFEETSELPILFSKPSNQIVDIKEYIDNPLLPKSIADELNNFYLIPPSQYVFRDHIDQQKIVLINSGVYIGNIWDDQKIKPENYLRTPSGFAYQSVENLLVCAAGLENKISIWLAGVGINEVNIRKDFKNA